MLNGQVQGILFILVIGAATDYSLLYVSRYREALRDHEKRWDATWAALRGSFEPILASGGTVIAGLLCLLLSDLNSNKALGPVAADRHRVLRARGAHASCPRSCWPAAGRRSGRCGRNTRHRWADARSTRSRPDTVSARTRPPTAL